MISWDMVGLDLSGLSLVSLIRDMQQVRRLCAWFSTTGGMPVSVDQFWLQV
jgi:hypothetical protein